jgi:UDP-N-acetylmuramoyl-tripeptide--D-alanyl-D-alanine ligase
VIGITGSFGKTSTKEILYTMLKEAYSVIATPKSYNTPFGISKTILSGLQDYHDVFVCEMGAKKEGEIKFLCNYTNVNCGIVTSVGRQHTNTFGNIDGVYRAKKELPDFLKNNFCVFNLSNKYVAKMYNEFSGNKIGVFLLKCSNYSFVSKNLKNKNLFKKSKTVVGKYFVYLKCNNVYAKKIICSDSGSVFNLYYNNSFICKVDVCLLGEHNILNLLMSVAMCIHLNVSIENIIISLNKIKTIKSRLEKIVMSNGAVVINNGYNSNIDIVESSFKAVELFDRKNRIIITPGLIESSNDYFYNFSMGQIMSRYFNKAIIVKEKNKRALSDGLLSMGFEKDKIIYVKNFKEAEKFILSGDGDDVFLIENDLPENFI